MGMPLHTVDNLYEIIFKTSATKPNISKLAREFDVPYHRLRARIHGRQSHADRAKATRTLDSIQEKALTSWIQTLDSAHISPTPKMIEEAANTMLKNAGEDRVVGHSWVYRFIARHPDLKDILQKRDLAAEGSSPLRIVTPSPPPDFPSSATNSPPDTIERVEKLNTKLLNDLERVDHISESTRRHIQQSMDANTRLVQELEILKAELKKSESHRSAANTPKSRKSLGTKGNVPSPVSANRMMGKRQGAENKKLAPGKACQGIGSSTTGPRSE
ncbi:hypothetical protein N7465_010626 [Penicillium sp. CMV-2018d]|nr:hypothetical protein N7465_010626 [Penicillium sp. CMV-2018d]